MPRAKNNVAAHARHKKVLDRAKGNFNGRSKLYRTALETVNRGLRYAWRDRRQKKRDFRRLWIIRISAATNNAGMNYSTFISGLKKAGVELNRKALADLAARDTAAFDSLIQLAKAA
jgi:large subunit ribosomal protein L20